MFSRWLFVIILYEIGEMGYIVSGIFLVDVVVVFFGRWEEEW